MMRNLQAIWDILGQLKQILDNKQKRNIVIVAFCTVIASVLELLGVSAMYPFLQAVLNPADAGQRWYFKLLYRIMPDSDMKNAMLAFGIIIILAYLVKNIFLVFNAYVQYTFAAQFQCKLSVRMLNAYMKRPYQFFLNTNSGTVMRGVTSDIFGTYSIVLAFLTMCTELLTTVVLAIFLFVVDWTMALGAVLLMGICFLTIVLGFKGKLKKAGEEMWLAQALRNQYGYQCVNGIKEIMVLDRTENFVNQFNEAAVLEQKATVINGFIGACPDRILEGVCICGFMGIVCIKIAIGIDLDTFIPVVGSFAMAAFRILPSIARISNRINTIVYNRPALDEVTDNLIEAEGYEHFPEKKKGMSYNQNEGVRFNREIVIKGVSWKYPNAEKNVLHNASLHINKGESVAFIGTSGAGKTTMADIIMGLLIPQEGAVEMDGIDISDLSTQWAKIIGYVPQTIFLIDDTVRRNVAFGLENDKISDAKVWSALEDAQLKEFVESLPFGLDTMVGERGVKFSGGQRQRVAIARALYENPDILVLDEATSALDNETETAVMESIDALHGSKTLIIVAHRLTTIRNCDRIYEICDGSALEVDKKDVGL